MESTLYACRTEGRTNLVYHRMHSVKKIISAPSLERIVFDNGEIELSVCKNKLQVCSKKYLPNGKVKVTKKITNSLLPGYAPRMALNKSKNDILQRIVNLEIESHEKQIRDDLSEYFRTVPIQPHSDYPEWGVDIGEQGKLKFVA